MKAATWAFLGVVFVAAAETMASAFVYRDTIAPENWVALREATESLPADEPVVIATDWLAPRARMEIPAVATLAAAGRPDLRGVERFHVIGYDTPWSDRLDTEWGKERWPPAPTSDRTFGPLRLTTYEADAARQVSTLVDADVAIATGSGRCRGRGRWKCQDAKVALAVVEVDYQPRRCFSVEAAAGVEVTISKPAMVTGDRLFGHVGFSDFNGRLRSDAPVTVNVSIDGDAAARFVATDAEGWRPFSVPISPGKHDVEVSLVVAASGTWGRNGYEPGKARPTCVELRSLEGGA